MGHSVRILIQVIVDYKRLDLICSVLKLEISTPA